MRLYESLVQVPEDREQGRGLLRSVLRGAIVDQRHLSPETANEVIVPAIILCATSDALKLSPQATGFIIQINDIGPNDFNFRFILSEGAELVDETTREIQAKAKRIYGLTSGKNEQNKKRASSKPKDPSLTPPARPRPDKFLPILLSHEKLLEADTFAAIKECVEDAPIFVWESRQIEDGTALSEEEIKKTVAALAEYGHLNPPFPRIWAETRDWLSFYDGKLEEHVRVPVSFGVAVLDNPEDRTINCWTFCELRGEALFSVFPAAIFLPAVAEERDGIYVSRPPFPSPEYASNIKFDEHILRAISKAGAERLIELLMLLSTRGVEKKTMRQAIAKNKKNQRHKDVSRRDYVIVRVPYFYVQDKAESGGAHGRWVRPHLRRAYMWGKNVRPQNEQRWTRACLVNAEKPTENEEQPSRREYRVT
jgi:hypothetical protein